MKMFDIIGDVHGCYDELIQLMKKLGYQKMDGLYQQPNRRLVFLGDITDRGPQSIAALQFVLRHVEAGLALYVPGNHCDKLYRFFLGRNVQINNGLETTVAEYNQLTNQEKKRVKTRFMQLVEKSPYYLTLDEGRLIVSHAGIRQDLIGRMNKAVKTFCLYGDITGEKHPDGRPVRRDWAKRYTGQTWIVYGHTPVEKPRFVNRTVNIDTGCVFGGHLTGLRYPELTYEMVPSSLPFWPEKFNRF